MRAFWAVAVLATVLLQPAWAEDIFDYVIVGAGTCGLVLAERLSRDSNINILVIEPGGDVRNNAAVTSIADWTENQDSAIDYDYKSAPQVKANNRVLTYHAGKAIGGTSTINGMTYIRGDTAEFDAWEALGNTGFNWASMFERMKGTEHFRSPDDAQVNAGATYVPNSHGRDGAVDVSFARGLDKTTHLQSVSATWASLGYSKIEDVNGGSVRGFSVWPHTVDYEKNSRSDSATAYYWRAAHSRPTLDLYQGTVRKIRWNKPVDGGSGFKAESVEYVNEKGELVTVGVKKEVILSAGSLRTPLNLEASGIGNPSLLNRLGIPVKVNLPGVGENLQDQLKQNLTYHSHTDVPGMTPYVTYMTIYDLWGNKTDGIAQRSRDRLADWSDRLANRKDNGLSATQIEKLLGIQHDLIFNKNVSVGEIMSVAHSTRHLSVFWALLPFSRGSVHLQSATENFDRPVIDPGFLEVELDLAMQVKVGRLAQKYFQTDPVRETIIENTVPGESVLPHDASEKIWANFVKGHFISNSHQIGTASMMSRDMGGVVDSQFRVYGTENVRVVDASIVPLQISGHLTPALYALAERAALMLAGDKPTPESSSPLYDESGGGPTNGSPESGGQPQPSPASGDQTGGSDPFGLPVGGMPPSDVTQGWSTETPAAKEEHPRENTGWFCTLAGVC